MPTFIARVRDSQGKPKIEKIRADSLAQARINLRQRGYVVQNLKKQSQRFNFKQLKTKFTNV